MTDLMGFAICVNIFVVAVTIKRASEHIAEAIANASIRATVTATTSRATK